MSKADKIIIFISILAIVMSIISAGINYFHNKEIERIEYGLNAVKNRPIVKIKIPHITEEIPEISNNENDLYLKFDLLYENKGKNKASILFTTWRDTTSGEELLRKAFFNKEIPKITEKNHDDKKFIRSSLEILTDEVFKDFIYKKVNLSKDSTFTFHILVFYENDLGQIFDTYHWFRFKKKIVINNNRIDSTKQKQTINYAIELFDKSSDYNFYNRKGREGILKILNNYTD